MVTIGTVTVGQTGQQRIIQIQQPSQTTIVNPNFTPNLKSSLSKLDDVSTVGVQNGYTLIYNSVTQKYETSPISNVALTITNITGGTF